MIAAVTKLVFVVRFTTVGGGAQDSFWHLNSLNINNGGANLLTSGTLAVVGTHNASVKSGYSAITSINSSASRYTNTAGWSGNDTEATLVFSWTHSSGIDLSTIVMTSTANNVYPKVVDITAYAGKVAYPQTPILWGSVAASSDFRHNAGQMAAADPISHATKTVTLASAYALNMVNRRDPHDIFAAGAGRVCVPIIDANDDPVAGVVTLVQKLPNTRPPNMKPLIVTAEASATRPAQFSGLPCGTYAASASGGRGETDSPVALDVLVGEPT